MGQEEAKKRNPKSNAFKESMKALFAKIKTFYAWIFSSSFKVTVYTGCLLFVLMMVYFVIIYYARKNIYCAFSDDTLQYYPFMVEFIKKLKAFDFSYFSYTNYLGASIFADAYYVPLDIFTLTILILSFFMNTEVAMSIVELIKLIAGATVLCLYLSMKGVKPKWVHLIGILYFSSSGITCFSCFPAFGSLAFYLPLSLVVGRLFLINKKWYLVPVYAMAVVFYNFYLAYTVFAFMAFSLLFMAIIEKEKWYLVIVHVCEYVLLIILGLGMAMAIFLPSVMYILKSTTRNVTEGTSSIVKLGNMFISYIDLGITAVVSFFKMIGNLFKYNISVNRNAYLFRDSFVQVRYLYHSMMKNITNNGVTSRYASLFNEEVLYRILGSLFVPSTPSSFYGYLSSYFLEHASLYITGTGILISSYVWFLKDYKSRIYRIMSVIILVFISVPFWSYIFSANLEVVYTRWMNVVSIPLLLMCAHVLSETDLYDVKPRNYIILGIILVYFGVVSSFHHLEKLTTLADTYNWGKELIADENKMFYLALALMGVAFLYLSLTSYIRRLPPNKKKALYPLTAALLIAGIVLVFVNGYSSLTYIVENEAHTSYGSVAPLYGADEMMINQYITIVTLLIIMIMIFAIANKKKKLVIALVVVEFIISGCFSFGAPVVFQGEETVFQNSENLGTFLEKNIDEPDIYRVYVDGSVSGVLSHNISRFLPTGSNSKVFHSFINASTDDVAKLIYGINNEGQAGKSAMNKYSYYLNVFLGYRYVVASPNSSFADYDPSIFKLVAKTDNYLLLEFLDYEPFLSYSSMVDEDQYLTMRYRLSSTAKTKFLLQYCVIDKADFESMETYLNDDTGVISTYSDPASSSTFTNTFYLKRADEVTINVDGVDRSYVRYEFPGNTEITTRSYALNINGFSGSSSDMADTKAIYLDYGDETRRYFLTSLNNRSMNGSSFHVPVYGSSNGSLFINGSDVINANDDGSEPQLQYVCIDKAYLSSYSYTLGVAVEAIFPSAADIASYESMNEVSSGLGSYFRYNVAGSNLNGLVTFSFSNSKVTAASLIAEYEDGTFQNLASEVEISKKIINLYVSKGSTGNGENAASLTTSTISFAYRYSDDYENKEITTKNSTITISYTNKSVSDGYNLIVIHIAYSGEWQVMNGEVITTVSANGGFLGIVVPLNITSNTITLKYVPYGLSDGIIISVISIVFYLLITIGWIYYDQKKHPKLKKIKTIKTFDDSEDTVVNMNAK